MDLLQRIPPPPGGQFRPFPDAAIAQSIPERFEEQVRLHGDRLALRWDRGSYDYAALNATANRLARTLLSRRASTAEPVALLFEHGGEALVAILAVLKSGKCYVVLDPGYPPERLEYMLQDCGATLVVADAEHAGFARQLCEGATEVVVFDAVDPGLPGTDLGVYPTPESLAMILYTSGSTGRPKGVMHTHRSVLVDVRNFTNGWSLVPQDRWLLSTSISFANSVRTIYGALLNGAAVFPFDVRKNGFGRLATWLQDHEITIMRNVPTFFRNFMAALDEGITFASIRILSLGGESMLGEDLAAFNLRYLPHCVLSHAFGPTECLTVCWALIPHGSTTSEGKLPIGYSLRDKDVVLLDALHREVASGEVGEIAVRSRYISPGYWNDSERTRAAFLPHPEERGLTTYLTGDFGRRAPDGSLVHVGRRDFQVKVRGFRIDVSEIENALRAMPGLRDAVVVGQPTEAGETRLVAYIVAETGIALPAGAMRAHLARKLPDYMIPSAFMAMASIPLTPNGKTDRLRLPRPGRDHRGAAGPLTAPRSAIEETLAAMWADVLGLDQVGAEDSFLALGGDSLQGAMIVARVAAQFKVDIPITLLFEAGTVAHMAQAVAAAQRDNPGVAAADLVRRSAHGNGAAS